MLIIFCMVSCSPQGIEGNKKEKAFSELTSGMRISEKLELSALSPDIDVLSLENLEDYCIKFPFDYNARIYTYDVASEEWIDVTKKIGFTSSDPNTLCPEVSAGLVPFFPDVYDSENITLRIVVSGEKLVDGIPNGEIVGTYTEIIWDPANNFLPDFLSP